MKKIKKVAIAIAIASAALVAGSLSGFLIANAVAPAQTVDYGSVNAVEKFPVNDSGQTYGFVDQGLHSDPSARAQLLAVTTDDGKDGWAYAIELLPAAYAQTPEEAEKLSTDDPYEVAVYELDGRTFIGFHTVNRLPEK